MAPKKKPWRAQKPFCLFPSMHDEVSALLEEDDLYFGFHGKDNPAGCVREYDTKIMGRFLCRNNACNTNGWSSMQIAITIRMYPGAEYNARVYKQRCKGCDVLGHLLLKHNSSYADRVAYRIKKWCGVDMELPPYSKEDTKGPHEVDLCEGCKAGHCREGARGTDGYVITQ